MTCIVTLPRKPKTLFFVNLLLFAKSSKIPLENIVLKIHLWCAWAMVWFCCSVCVTYVTRIPSFVNAKHHHHTMFDDPSVPSSSLVKSVSFELLHELEIIRVWFVSLLFWLIAALFAVAVIMLMFRRVVVYRCRNEIDPSVLQCDSACYWHLPRRFYSNRSWILQQHW